MKLLKYFLFVLLAPSILLACTSDLTAMQQKICRPGFRLIADLNGEQSGAVTNQTVEKNDSSDEETDDESYETRHSPHELEEISEVKIFKRERSARIRSEKKRLITCSACKKIHVVPETENFRVIQSNADWACNNICWEADDIFVDGVAVCAATLITLHQEDDNSLDSESSISESEKENQLPKNKKKRAYRREGGKRIVYWVSCTNCSAWRIVPATLVKSGEIDMKKLARKENWICADATWKGPNGLTCKH